MSEDEALARALQASMSEVTTQAAASSSAQAPTSQEEQDIEDPLELYFPGTHLEHAPISHEQYEVALLQLQFPCSPAEQLERNSKKPLVIPLVLSIKEPVMVMSEA